MKTFNKILMTLGILIATATYSGLADAAVPPRQNDVRFTVHNLSSNNDATQGLTVGQRNFYSSNVDQVCIFCHTPHNANPSAPLWNHALSRTAAANFKMYTANSTLTNATKLSKLTDSSPSMLCLSCHDGKTAINVLHNSKTGTPSVSGNYPATDIVVNAGTTPGVERSIQFFSESLGYLSPANIGGREGDAASRARGDDLTDDHPIGFSYDAALTDTIARGGTGLNTRAAATTAGVKFFGGTNTVECSTCHDPHTRYDGALVVYRPFLRMHNTGSAMCLACHNK